MDGPIKGTKDEVKMIVSHPVGMFVFGMLFAAFVFPIVAVMLGKWKAKGGTVSKLIPTKFTSAASGTV